MGKVYPPADVWRAPAGARAGRRSAGASGSKRKVKADSVKKLKVSLATVVLKYFLKAFKSFLCL